MSLLARSFLLVLIAARLAGAAEVDLLLVASDDATLRPILQRITSASSETRGVWTLWRGQLGGKNVTLTRTEGDPLNAVAATTLALRLHPPRLVVVFGSARAHDPALRPGDVVVSSSFAAFDGMITPITALGGGSAALQWMPRPHPLMTAGERETRSPTFPAHADAAALAAKLAPKRGRVVMGVLGSAHQTNREADRIAWLREQWGTSTEDGESAHVAGCAALFGVPVVSFRVVDGTPEEATEFALRFLEAWK